MLFLSVLICFNACSLIACLVDTQAGNDIYALSLPDIHNEKEIHSVLQQLQSPFTREEKDALIKDWVTGDRLLDRGMFPVILLQSNTKTINQKTDSYMFYKTAKYVLQTIMHFPEHVRLTELEKVLSYATYKKTELQKLDNFSYYTPIIQGWYGLYKQIQWFIQNRDTHPFTLSAMFNILLRSALLQDLGQKNSILYMNIDMQPIEEILLAAHIDIDYTDHYLNKQATIFNSGPLLLSHHHAKVDINALKKWFNNNSQFIIPIVNKSGIIGINSFNIAIPSRFLLICFGQNLPRFHNLTFSSFSDASFHDILHGYLPLYLDPDQAIPSPNRSKFYTIVLKIMPNLIDQYREAYITKNDASKQIIIKHIYSLFLILHEAEPDAHSYDNPKNRHSLSKVIYELIAFKKLKKCNPNTYIPQKILNSIYFNTLDLLFLFKKAYPFLSNIVTYNNLQIKNGTLVSTDQKGIPYTNLSNVLEYLIFCMTDAWNLFVNEYQSIFEGTIPFLRQDLSTL